jgi:hypothetical protein
MIDPLIERLYKDNVHFPQTTLDGNSNANDTVERLMTEG